MTKAEMIARYILEGSAGPFYVAGTETQRNRILKDATLIIQRHLPELAEEFKEPEPVKPTIPDLAAPRPADTSG